MLREPEDLLAIADRCLDLDHPHGGPKSRRYRIALALCSMARECFDEAGWRHAASVHIENHQKLTEAAAKEQG